MFFFYGLKYTCFYFELLRFLFVSGDLSYLMSQGLVYINWLFAFWAISAIFL